MKRSIGIIQFLAFLLFAWAAVPAGAQSTSKPAPVHPAPLYDVSKEVTLQGTVSNVVTKPGTGMLLGNHLIVGTAQGAVDAHVGRALEGKNPIKVKSGDAVKLTGVMATIQHNQVFLVRSVEDNGTTYAVRSDHGLLLKPANRSANSAPKGGLQR